MNRGKAEREGNRRAARRLAELEQRAAAIEPETVRHQAMRELLAALLERSDVRDAVPGRTRLVPTARGGAVTVIVQSASRGPVAVGVITLADLDARVAAIAIERQ